MAALRNWSPSDSSLWKKKKSQKWLRFVFNIKSNNNHKIIIIKQKHYKGHLEQPHSRAVSISSEYEVPSVQRKTTFLLLLLVTPQHTPVGAAAWQDRGQSIRGILLVDVHVLSGWWRFSCSLTISPWHVNSGHEMRRMFTDFNWFLRFQSSFWTDINYLCHRWARCILADSDRRAPRSPKGDTLRCRSAAPCRPEAPASDHSTDPGSLRCTCNCRSLPLAHTDPENIWRNDKTPGQSSACWAECFICDCLAGLMRVIQMLARLPAVGLPVAQTGVGCCHLGTQNPVAPWRAVTCYSGLSSLPTRSLGTNTAGVTPRKNAVALVTGEMQS